MSEKKEVLFADGIYFKRNENAPEFVVGKVKFKVDEAIKTLKEFQSDGWLSVDIKQSKSGNYYVEVDTWKPEGGFKKKKNETPVTENDTPVTETTEELPF